MVVKVFFAPTTNREDWVDQFTDRDFTTGQLIDITGATVTLALVRLGDVGVRFDLASGVSLPSVGTVAWSIPASTMSQLQPGNYAVGCVAKLAGASRQLFTGVLPIIDGVTP
jgi:hypothetical protein